MTDELRLQLIKENCWIIELIPHPSEQEQLIAVQQCPETIFVIDTPTEQAQMLALSANSKLIKEIKNPGVFAQLMGDHND